MDNIIVRAGILIIGFVALVSLIFNIANRLGANYCVLALIAVIILTVLWFLCYEPAIISFTIGVIVFDMICIIAHKSGKDYFISALIAVAVVIVLYLCLYKQVNEWMYEFYRNVFGGFGPIPDDVWLKNLT